MFFDHKRRAYILQQRSFWMGLFLIMFLIALGLEVSFRIPAAVGSSKWWLFLLLAGMVWLVLKINFTVLLSIQVELHPDTGKLLMRSLFNQKEVSATIRAIELAYPEEVGFATLTIVAEDERYPLFRWVASDEENRVHESYARHIARVLGRPIRKIRAGQPREVTQPSSLKFRAFMERNTEPGAFRNAFRRLLESPGRARIGMPTEERSLDVRWTPTRRPARSAWAFCGALLGAVILATLADVIGVLATPHGFFGVAAVSALWLYFGVYIYFAAEQLLLIEERIHHRLANPIARLAFLPMHTPFSAKTAELENSWVVGDEQLTQLYLEFRRDLIAIPTHPLDGTDLAGSLSYRMLGGAK